MNKIVEMKYIYVFTGLLKLAVLVSIFFLAVFLAYELLESNVNLNLGKVLGEFMHAAVLETHTEHTDLKPHTSFVSKVR